MTPATFDPARPRGYVHASARLAERHGLELTPDDHLRLSRMVAENDLRAVPVAHLSKGRIMVAYHLGGRWIPAVWSPTSGTIITFRFPERLDRYRAMLARIDPETGKAWESGREPAGIPTAAPPAPSPDLVRPSADRPFVGRIIERGDGVPIPHGWGATKARKAQASPATGPVVILDKSLTAEATRLADLWAARDIAGPAPDDPDLARAERQANMEEIAAIIAERDTPQFNCHQRSASKAKRQWFRESGQRLVQLYRRNSELRSQPGPSDELPWGRKRPGVWWADYADLCRIIGAPPTTDPSAILRAVAAAIDPLIRRIDDGLGPEERAAFRLIQRWLIRDRKGPPPDYIDRPAPPDEIAETGAPTS